MTSDEMPRCEALKRQGNTLLELAGTRQGKVAEELFRTASVSYLEALRLKPDMADAQVGLGCARLALASRTIDKAEREELLHLAHEVLLRAERLGAKAAAYNLACGAALDGDLAECGLWLERCKEDLRLPPAEQLRTDPDLAAVRGEPWFAALSTRRALTVL